MLRNSIISLLILSLTGCLPADKSNDSECTGACAAKILTECSTLDASAYTYIDQLVSGAIDPSHRVVPNGEFDPNASFNKIEELARIGCSRPSAALVAEAIRLHGTLSSDGSGYLDIENYRTALAIVHYFENTLMADGTTIATLKLYAGNTNPIRDSADGLTVRNSAISALAAIDSRNSSVANVSIKLYQDAWNSNFPVCSTNYLLADGSRSGFISDWSIYENSIAALSPDSSVLQAFLNEDFYCDGGAGYRPHLAALDRLSLEDKIQESRLLVNALRIHERRGKQLYDTTMWRLHELSVDPSASSDAFDSELISLLGPTAHVDERVRARTLEILTNRCLSGVSIASLCKIQVRTLARYHFEKDWYLIVRKAALSALQQLSH